MYSRLVCAPPKKLVENGRPVFGTFGGAPERLDIRNVRRPFGVLPMPEFITNTRIRSRLSFFFCTDGYIGNIDFLDAKLFGYAELSLWHTADAKKYAYRCVSGPKKHLIPHLTAHGLCAASQHMRHFRVSWNRSRGEAAFTFDVRGDSVRPSLSGTLTADLTAASFCEMSGVYPAPVMRRCRGVYRFTAPVQGHISRTAAVSREQDTAELDGSMMFLMSRAYCKLRTHTDMVFACGNSGGHSVSFCIVETSLEAVDPDTYNENVLFTDGAMTPLPPVRITRPYGVTGKWIIQDTESMIDLTFTPISDNIHRLSIFVLRAVDHLVYGKFEGVLLTAAGERIVLKGFPGMAKKQNLRL